MWQMSEHGERIFIFISRKYICVGNKRLFIYNRSYDSFYYSVKIIANKMATRSCHFALPRTPHDNHRYKFSTFQRVHI